MTRIAADLWQLVSGFDGRQIIIKIGERISCCCLLLFCSCAPPREIIGPFTRSERLQIDGHFLRKRQVARVESLNLVDGRACILGEIEDVYLSLRQNDPHAYCRMTDGVYGVNRVSKWIVLYACSFKHSIELPLDYPRGGLPVLVGRKEQIIFTVCVGVAKFDAAIY